MRTVNRKKTPGIKIFTSSTAAIASPCVPHRLRGSGAQTS